MSIDNVSYNDEVFNLSLEIANKNAMDFKEMYYVYTYRTSYNSSIVLGKSLAESLSHNNYLGKLLFYLKAHNISTGAMPNSDWAADYFIHNHYETDFDTLYMNRIIKTLDNVESSEFRSDLLMLTRMHQILEYLNGSDVFTLEEWFDLWDKNSVQVIRSLGIEWEDSLEDSADCIANCVDKILRQEYLINIVPYSDTVKDDSDFTLGFRENKPFVLFDQNREKFNQRINGINEVISYYNLRKWYQADDHKLFADGPYKAYIAMLFSHSSKPSHSVIHKLLQMKPAERMAVSTMGSHIIKNEKYTQEIIKLIIPHLNDVNTRITSNYKGKTRLFNDRFLLRLLDIEKPYDVKINPADYNDDIIRIVQKLLPAPENKIGTIQQQGFLDKIAYSGVWKKYSISYNRNIGRIVKNKSDINYIIALAVNTLGAEDGLSLIIDAAEQLYTQDDAPTVSQWERLINGYKDEYKNFPFEISIELTSRRKKS